MLNYQFKGTAHVEQEAVSSHVISVARKQRDGTQLASSFIPFRTLAHAMVPPTFRTGLPNAVSFI